jgi:hypothetical protein
MLSWMSVNEELRPFFTEGRIIGKSSLISILASEEGFDPGASMADRDKLILKRWNSDFSPRMISKRLDDIIEDDPQEWTEIDEPRQVSSGVILYATDIDWEAGVLDGSYSDDFLSDNEALFWDRDEMFASSFHKADYDVLLKGLSFPLDTIEMLQPGVDKAVVANSATRTSARLGRPPRWDWEGAITAIVVRAQHPDGLATGPGAQAELERQIAEWFVAETGDAPASSQIRLRASRAIKMLESPEK